MKRQGRLPRVVLHRRDRCISLPFGRAVTSSRIARCVVTIHHCGQSLGGQANVSFRPGRSSKLSLPRPWICRETGADIVWAVNRAEKEAYVFSNNIHRGRWFVTVNNSLLLSKNN